MTSVSPTVIKDLPVTVIPFPRDSLESQTWARGDEVLRELHNHGCFMAKYDKLDGNRSKLFEASKKIFDRLAKTSYSFDFPRNHQYEIFDIPEAITDKGKKSNTGKQLKGNNDMRKDIHAYTSTATELEEMVRKIVFGDTELPKTDFRFQMMKHKEEVRLDFPDRKDREKFLAVLDLNQDNDWEMRANIGSQCYRINVRPSTYLVMAGKPLKDWSEGKIHPLDGNKEGYSVGLFSYYDKGKIDKGNTDGKGQIDKGNTDDKGKIDKGNTDDKGKIDKGNTEAPKEQVGSSTR